MNEKHFTVKQGVTFSVTVELTNVLNDTPYNLTNFSARGQVRKRPWTSTTLATIDCDLDSLNSTINITLTSAQTATFPMGRVAYDVEIYDTSSPEVVYTVLEGWFEVRPAVTR